MLPGGEHFQACLKFKRNVAGKSHPVIVSRDISPLLCIQKIPLSPRPPVSLAFPHTRILMGSSMCPTTEKVGQKNLDKGIRKLSKGQRVEVREPGPVFGATFPLEVYILCCLMQETLTTKGF